MPLVLRLDTDEGSSLGLWRMDETDEELKGFQFHLKAAEFLDGPHHPLRKRQLLCTRILLETLLHTGPIEIRKDDAGRPWPTNIPGFLSISHTRSYVTVLYNSNRPCGVDLEYPSERILRIASRFLHPAESEQIRAGHVVQDTTLIWCVKECLFKQIGRQGVIFKDELRVQLPENPDVSQASGQAFDLHLNPPEKHRYHLLRLDNLLLVHTIA